MIFIFTAETLSTLRTCLIFLLSAETRLTRLSPPVSQTLRAGESDGGQGAESKNQPPLGASTGYCQ